uniref:cytochrome b n=1 Tax=Cochlostyla marinduquensis TaxID=2079772 RepID=UPI00233E7AF0|nr:cytochrome b [Cochlostyla marinduquensis]UIX22050.1 cytochrome b [Cochlostyla marinduquensis]
MKKIRTLENLSNLPSPSNLSIMWNMGSLLGLVLSMQILTGILLSFHYSSSMNDSFNSIMYIMRDVPGGWCIRLLHMNGATMYFIFLYLHIGRGLYYQSYLLQWKTWMVGVSIFLLSIITAFLGYVLPWGQMSYWGATVITNLLGAIPYVGQELVTWVWGGYSVNHATLKRFYSLHFLCPFVIMLLSMIHLVYLHEKGSSNMLGNISHSNKISFHPYYTYKDIVGFVLMMMVLMFIISFYPNVLNDPENYMEANPMVTPIHIQPEWYFLFAYAILRSIPSKVGGVVAMVMSILFMYMFPLFMKMNMMSTNYSKVSQVIFWYFVMTFVMLTWLGSCPVDEPYVSVSRLFTLLYFVLPIMYIFMNLCMYKLLY